MAREHPVIRRLARALLNKDEYERLRGLQLNDSGHGYDTFGAHREWVAFGAGLFSFLYESYFRVQSHGAENIPSDQGAILASNHSGTLPFDAIMLFADVLRRTEPPRLPRPAADFFVPMLPFVAILFSRGGVVAGTRRNVQKLLESGELLMVFPEGVPGVGKLFSERYQLQTWRVGHCELAIRNRVPVVPVAIVGPEEQMPQVGRLPGIFGAPYIPLTLTPLPLPVRYHIRYGAPLPFHEDYRPEQADDPAVLLEAAGRVKAQVRALLDRGLEERKGVFA